MKNVVSQAAFQPFTLLDNLEQFADDTFILSQFHGKILGHSK